MGKATEPMRVTDEKRPEPAIFLHSYEVVRELMGMTTHFAKPTRYGLGRRLDEQAMNFLLALTNIVGPSGVTIGSASVRMALLHDLSRDLDQMRILLRLSRDLGCVSAGQHENILARLMDIGMQLGGLIRAQKNRLDPT